MSVVFLAKKLNRPSHIIQMFQFLFAIPQETTPKLILRESIAVATLTIFAGYMFGKYWPRTKNGRDLWFAETLIGENIVTNIWRRREEADASALAVLIPSSYILFAYIRGILHFAKMSPRDVVAELIFANSALRRVMLLISGVCAAAMAKKYIRPEK